MGAQPWCHSMSDKETIPCETEEEPDYKAMLRELVGWSIFMGGFEAPVWHKAIAMVRKAYGWTGPRSAPTCPHVPHVWMAAASVRVRLTGFAKLSIGLKKVNNKKDGKHACEGEFSRGKGRQG